jgi:hypothetical protein
MGRIDEAVAVLVDQEGAPTLFRWREKDYQVSSRPVRWFARSEWWVGERAHRGIGSGAVEVEMWRFLASHSDDLGSQFELLHSSFGNSWKLIRKYEG